MNSIFGHSKKNNLLLIFTFFINTLNISIVFNLGIKTVLHLKYNRFNGYVGVLNRKAEKPA